MMECIKKKSWIINTVFFVLAFIYIFVQVSELLKPDTINRENIVGLYNEAEDSIDIVCIGGSSTYTFFAPYIAYNEYGFTSYNLSAEAMSPALIKNLIYEAKESQTPQLYVVDLRAFDVREQNSQYYKENFVRKVTDHVRYSLNRLDMINYAFGYEQTEFTEYEYNYFDISLWHSNWQKVGESNYRYLLEDVKAINKGFIFVTNYWHKELTKKDWSSVTEEMELSEQTNNIFLELLDYCEDENINVLFTVNPFYQDTSETKQRYNYMERIIEERGFKFINTNDYYDQMGIDFTTDFYDENHTNILGAEKYTRFLGKYIMDSFELDLNHDSTVVKDWNAGYIEWEIRVQNHKNRLYEEMKK